VSELDSLVAWEYLLLIIDKLIGLAGADPVDSVCRSGCYRRDCPSCNLASRADPTDFPVGSSARERRGNHEQLHPQQYFDLPDRRLRGVRFLTGLLSFFCYLQCGVDRQCGIAAAVCQQHYAWWLLALASIAVGLVWN
jgi:dolichol-phosphate mannosyltransferase